MLCVQCKGAKAIISSLASHAKKRGCTDRAPPLLLISYTHEGAAAASARVVSPLGERMGASKLGQFRARVPERRIEASTKSIRFGFRRSGGRHRPIRRSKVPGGGGDCPFSFSLLLKGKSSSARPLFFPHFLFFPFRQNKLLFLLLLLLFFCPFSEPLSLSAHPLFFPSRLSMLPILPYTPPPSSSSSSSSHVVMKSCLKYKQAFSSQSSPPSFPLLLDRRRRPLASARPRASSPTAFFLSLPLSSSPRKLYGERGWC